MFALVEARAQARADQEGVVGEVESRGRGGARGSEGAPMGSAGRDAIHRPGTYRSSATLSDQRHRFSPDLEMQVRSVVGVLPPTADRLPLATAAPTRLRSGDGNRPSSTRSRAPAPRSIRRCRTVPPAAPSPTPPP
jgi:hypothetical protein